MIVSDQHSPERIALASIPRAAVPAVLSTPAAYIDLDVLRANIARMADHARASGVSLRPHVKTHKCANIGRMQLEAGATGITVGTLREAEVFAEAGFDDIFMAFTAYASPDKAGRIGALHEKITFRVGIDSIAGAVALAAACRRSERPLEVLVEVDCGEHRTGVLPSNVGDLASVAAKAGLSVVGAFTHGGHGYESRAARVLAADDEVAALEAAALSLSIAGFTPLILSAGSTPTVDFSSRGVVTEQRPGTYALNDAGQVALGTCTGGDVALRVAATVVSVAVPGQLIIDAGTKAIAREPASYLPGYGWIPDLPDSVINIVNDYHGYVSLGAAGGSAVGSRVAVIPNHVCPVVNLFAELAIVQAGEVVDVWAVDARGQ